MSFIVFLLIIAVVILILNTRALRDKFIISQEEILNLHRKQKDLNDKLYFLYNILKDMDAIPDIEPQKENQPQQEAAKAGVVLTKSAAEQDKAETPAALNNEKPLNAAVPPVSQSVHTSAPTTPQPVGPVAQPQQVYASQSQPVGPAAQPQQVYAAQSEPVNPAAQLQQVYTEQMQRIKQAVPSSQFYTEQVQRVKQAVQSPQFYTEQVQRVKQAVQRNIPNTAQVQQFVKTPHTSAPQKKKHVEEWLGARLFNIAASLLIFIGLIMFCTLSSDVVTNTMKMCAMFAVSGGFIAVGAFLSRKDRSIFPLGMLGTGFGSFFISILLSHVYFHSLNDIEAFGLILIWSAFALFLSKKLNSVMLSITAHIGTAISICFAYSLGFTAEKVIILTIYQFAAIAVIIIGNIFCCRKTYRFGLIMTQGLLVYTSIAMSVAFSQKFIMPNSISVPAAITIYAIQFFAVSFISYLVATSAAALEKENNDDMDTIAILIQLINKIFWLGGTLSTVAFITHYICRNAYHIDTLLPTTAAIAAAALLHLVLTLIMEEKLSFSETLATLSMWFVSLTIMIDLMAAAKNVGAPFIFIFVLLLIGIFKLTKNNGVTHIALTLLAAEALYMCFYGYFKLANVWISIPYMVALGLVLLLSWYIQDGKHKQNYFKSMKIAQYLWISASIIPINASQFSSISVPLIISEFALMNIICYFIKFGSEKEPELRLVVKIESSLTVYIGIFALAFENLNALGDNAIIKAVLCVMVFILAFIEAYEFIRTKINVLQAAGAATIAAYFTFLAIGFQDHFKPFEYIASTLHCVPFFFLYSVILIGIYLLNKNRNLKGYIWPALIIDMFYMSFYGYHSLILEAYDYYTNNLNLGLHIILTGIALAHAATDLGLSFVLNGESTENQSNRPKNIQRYISYFWINLAFPILAFNFLYKTSFDNYKWVVAMMILTAVNTAVFALGYQGKYRSKFNYAVRIVSAVAFYMALPSISNSHSGLGRYAASVILMLFCAALFFVKAREILKNDRSVPWQVYIGLNSTIFINAACSGLTSAYDLAYIFSIVTMTAALICIIVGFAAKAKGIRVYGLVVVMLCIIKLVTFDISGADSLARVMAFIVGGIICFIISGIYNRMEKHFKMQEQNVPVMQTVSANGAPINTVSAPIAETVNTAVNAPIENTPQAAPENQPSVTAAPAETAQESTDKTADEANSSVTQDTAPTETVNNTENIKGNTD